MRDELRGTEVLQAFDHCYYVIYLVKTVSWGEITRFEFSLWWYINANANASLYLSTLVFTTRIVGCRFFFSHHQRFHPNHFQIDLCPKFCSLKMAIRKSSTSPRIEINPNSYRNKQSWPRQRCICIKQRRRWLLIPIPVRTNKEDEATFRRHNSDSKE